MIDKTQTPYCYEDYRHKIFTFNYDYDTNALINMSKIEEYGQFCFRGISPEIRSKLITEEVMDYLLNIGMYDHDETQKVRYYYPWLDSELKRIHPELFNLLCKSGMIIEKSNDMRNEEKSIDTSHLPYSKEFKEMDDLLRFRLMTPATGGNFFVGNIRSRGNMLSIDKFFNINYKFPHWPTQHQYKGMQLIVIGRASLIDIVEYDGGKIALFSDHKPDYFIPLANSFFEFLDMCFDKNSVVFEDGSTY